MHVSDLSNHLGSWNRILYGVWFEPNSIHFISILVVQIQCYINYKLIWIPSKSENFTISY